VPLFDILASWNWDFSKVVRPSIHRHLASTKPLFGLLVAWQWDFSRVMRLLAEEFRASDVQLVVTLEAWKSDSSHVVKSSIQANLLHVNHCSKFLLLQKVNLQRVKRPSYKGLLAFIEIQLSTKAACKKRFLKRPGPSVKGYVANCERKTEFLWPIIPIHGTSCNPSLKVHGLCESILSNSVD
jgi:hypothetical protein